jgi:CheY-like chemotaxis protein
MQVHQRIILHIDDDEDDRALLKEAIFEQDATIVVRDISNGKEGIAFLQRAKQLGGLPSLIVLDMNMPAMDGRQVAIEIRKDQELASIPLVIFTTSPYDTDKDFAVKEGIEIFLKPTSQQKLVQVVDKLLSYCPVGRK